MRKCIKESTWSTEWKSQSDDWLISTFMGCNWPPPFAGSYWSLFSSRRMCDQSTNLSIKKDTHRRAKEKWNGQIKSEIFILIRYGRTNVQPNNLSEMLLKINDLHQPSFCRHLCVCVCLCACPHICTHINHISISVYKNAYIKNRNLFVAVVVDVWIGRRPRESLFFFARFVCQWTWRCLSFSQSRGHFAWNQRDNHLSHFLTVYLIFYSNPQTDLHTINNDTKTEEQKKNDKINEMKIQKQTCRTAQCR